ncbi:MAG: aspartate--tRNA ligase [Desulfobacteraceae bacterium]|nr:MAG: aspartate--tRNA ligase [Desulfobacteraceae bacterium]
MNWKERTYCGELRPTHAGRTVLLMGWVDAIRDHGNLLFIHMRDVRGTVQVVFDPTFSSKSYALAASLREEYVIQVKGRVSPRASGTENPNLLTGSVEVFADDMEILSESRTLPFPISEKAMVFGEELKSNPANVDEDLRLRYRYLDLRRPSMQECFLKRYQIVRTIRDYLHSLNFIEVETPFLTKSTPEGARDYLVPSRVHQGRFYALPQSPQLFKQLIMMAGMDRYFQIVKCFRDEDLRPNRQPEFTQLDMEASFIDEEFIYDVVEDLTARIFRVGGIELPRPFPRMTYQSAMERYGNDKPDLRFDMAFEEITDLVRETGYTIFRQIVAQGGVVKGFCVRGRAEVLSKNVLQNEYALKIAPEMGAKGMTWMKVVEGKLQSNIAQFFRPVELEGIMARFKALEGDVLVMIADTSRDIVNKVLSQLRLHMAERLGLVPADRYTPLWVTDFPLFEKKDEGIGSQHHPFTMPDRIDFDPGNVEELLSLKSRAYDLVMNGEELGGGSIRIHRMDIQQKIFQSLGMGPRELESKFGFFLRALEYGAPPHGGLALGLDRVIAMILKMPSIRDVISFPKNRSAFCPLTEAPSEVDSCQMQELGLNKATEARAESSRDGVGAKIHRAPAKKRESISMDDVKHVARLARLKISNEEARAYQKELDAVLNHFEVLQSLDTENVTPMSQVLKTANVWREDVPAEKKDTESLLEASPVREKNFYKVPRILEG